LQPGSGRWPARSICRCWPTSWRASSTSSCSSASGSRSSCRCRGRA